MTEDYRVKFLAIIFGFFFGRPHSFLENRKRRDLHYGPDKIQFLGPQFFSLSLSGDRKPPAS
jgi:hypothetical protein